MDKASIDQVPFPGTRQVNLKRSFKLAINRILTSISYEDFRASFPKFTDAEQAKLHRLFIQILNSLHENVEDEFESICLDTQVGITLETVEQLIEERSMNPLFADQTNDMEEVMQDMVMTKKNAMKDYTNILERAEKQKYILQTRIELLKKEMQESSGSTDALAKLAGTFEMDKPSQVMSSP